MTPTLRVVASALGIVLIVVGCSGPGRVTSSADRCRLTL